MQVRGTLAARKYSAQPDIASWANQCALNPARRDASRANDPAISSASDRLAGVAERGLARLSAFAGVSLSDIGN
jgi:hypothetical protein